MANSELEMYLDVVHVTEDSIGFSVIGGGELDTALAGIDVAKQFEKDNLEFAEYSQAQTDVETKIVPTILGLLHEPDIHCGILKLNLGDERTNIVVGKGTHAIKHLGSQSGVKDFSIMAGVVEGNPYMVVRGKAVPGLA